jgi:ferredoxin
VLPGDYTPEKYYQPVDLAGQPTNFLKALPVLLDKKCIGCGRCQAVCPVESIEMEKCTPKMPFGGSVGGLGMPNLAAMKMQAPVVKGICIKCQACVKVCPKGAWTFEDEAFLRHVEMLTHTYGDAERENEFFL